MIKISRTSDLEKIKHSIKVVREEWFKIAIYLTDEWLLKKGQFSHSLSIVGKQKETPLKKVQQVSAIETHADSNSYFYKTTSVRKNP